jgi:L,D-transpeptidase catalytic domain
MWAREAVPRLDSRLARWLAVSLGLGLLTLGSLAGAARAQTAPSEDQLVGVALSNGRTISRWAYARTAGIVRRAPSRGAARVGQLHFLTAGGQAEVYMALRETRIVQSGVAWIEVTLPQRPNGVTGWVEASALDRLHVVGGYLLVSRSQFRATLYNRSGRVLWSAPVGVGRASLPTPAGHFYVVEKLQAFNSPVFGPFAIGTSAYAPRLSEWPGGGVIGIHGTDQPLLIPGDPSHGCVRMRNGEIARLWHLIAIGTPVDIT